MFDCPSHLARLRRRAPLVQNITNHVAMNVMANVLLAIGASPAMVHAREEVAEFAALADALSINIGTLSAEWVESMEIAARAANQAGTPWVFDPVAVGATAYRRRVGARLVELNPTVIRGNASEIIALASASGGGRGVDSTDAVEAAEQAAITLAARTGGVVAVSGPVDFVTDGRRRARVANGHPMMSRITVMGCSQTGVIAAFLVGAEDRFEAVLAAMTCYAVAGEIAHEQADGPGSFAVAFLDVLHQLDDSQLNARLRVEIDDVL
ncbi:hydroxyethylthiazole kinase [Modicisalibacter ilicicola DSM 19980]|uniref:Hydroxyethylthiazole kinase n=1 Tax=Modicisalibacter ilicicola DSM 19980 TaxID=1121942 RepID=A0A1M4WIJ3_9GAMM|nr:hydroxyethylthiazole kinase [Halomonas ilicicola]SHE81048.1 hydroxyethylthiazole kinase [Halomonas ilicicola DSM 19980]